MQRGKYMDALMDFGKSLALKPGDARALNNRGVALQAMGQMESARADFEAALRADPCQFDARLNLKRFDPPANCRYSDEQRRAMGR
jgi:Flp pilus assembly protein TadD